jgi:hypothetical protein
MNRLVHIGLVVVLWAASQPEVRGQPPQPRASTATIVIRGSAVAELEGPTFPITLRHSGGQSTVERPDAAREARFVVPAHASELLRIHVDGWPRLPRTWVPRRAGEPTLLEPDPCCGAAFEDRAYRQPRSRLCPRNPRGGPCTADGCECPPATESVWYTVEDSPCDCVIAPQLRVVAENVSRPLKLIVNPDFDHLAGAELWAVIGSVDRATTPYLSVSRGRASLWSVRVVSLEDERDEAKGEYFSIAPETGWRYTVYVTDASVSRVTRDKRIVLRGRR